LNAESITISNPSTLKNRLRFATCHEENQYK